MVDNAIWGGGGWGWGGGGQSDLGPYCLQYNKYKLHKNINSLGEGAQWLNGRVLDSRLGPRVRASLASLCCGP